MKIKVIMKELEEIIEDYLQAKDSDYAFMISGDWGCGKTYYLHHDFKDFVEKQNCPFDPDVPGIIKKKTNRFFKKDQIDYNYEIAFISLYGVSSPEDFSYRVFLGVNNWAKNKIIGLLGATGSKLAGFFNISLNKEDASKINVISNNTVLVFDDFERICQDKISSKEVLGLINDYAEHCHYKVIIACNENIYDENANSFLGNEEYGKYKEKTIRFTYKFEADIPNVYDTITDSIEDKSFNQYLKVNKQLILELFGIGGNKNLRTLKFFVDTMYKIFKSIKELKNKESILRTTTIATLIYAIEFKNGNGIEKLKELKAKVEINIAGSSFVLPEQTSENDTTESYSDIVSTKYGSYFQNDMVQMTYIVDYLANGYLDIEKFNNQLKKIDDGIESAKVKPEYQLLQELHSFSTIDDDTIIAKLHELISYVEQEKFGIIDLAKIYALLIQYDFFKLDGFELNDRIRDIFIAAIDKLGEDWNYFDDLEMKLPMWDNREKATDAYNKYSHLKEHILEINNQSKIREDKKKNETFLKKAEQGDVAGIRHYREGYENKISLSGIDWNRICKVLLDGKNDIACELAQCVKYQLSDRYSINKKDLTNIRDVLGKWLNEYAKGEDRRVRRTYILKLKDHIDYILRQD